MQGKKGRRRRRRVGGGGEKEVEKGEEKVGGRCNGKNGRRRGRGGRMQ